MTVNRRKLQEAIESLQKKYGEETVKIAKDAKEIKYISTGLNHVDRMLGGGLAQGKMTMIIGPEGAGKTSFALHMASKYDFSVYINAERAYDTTRAKLFGIDETKTLIFDPKTAEQALSAAIQFSEAAVPLIIVDSVPALVPLVEFELEDNMEKEAPIARLAKLLSRKLPAINNVCNDTGTTILFINQERDNVGSFGYGQQTYIPCGHAIRHYCHVIFRVQRKGKLEISEEVLGMIMKFSTGIKNRGTSPFQEAEIPFLFKAGFCSDEDVQKKMKELRSETLTARRANSRL